jgi:hypothetical protein
MTFTEDIHCYSAYIPKVFIIKGMVREYNSRKKTFLVRVRVRVSKRASEMENYTKEELLEELHDEEPEESEDDPAPTHLDAVEIEEVIDSMTE